MSKYFIPCVHVNDIEDLSQLIGHSESFVSSSVRLIDIRMNTRSSLNDQCTGVDINQTRKTSIGCPRDGNLQKNCKKKKKNSPQTNFHT